MLFGTQSILASTTLERERNTLNALIVLGEDRVRGDFTPESVTNLQNELNDARIRLASATATRSLLRSSIIRLTRAIDNLDPVAPNNDDIAILPFDPDEIITDPETDFMYVANQILLTAVEGTSRATVEELISTYNGSIVGFIAITDDYQVKIGNEATLAQLKNIVEQLMESSIVEFASLHHVIETDLDHVPNDARWNIGWDENNPEGLNWGVEAIRAPSAWNYNTRMSHINVGLIDCSFDVNHEDLTFTGVFNNDGTNHSSHGTHVAGTMAANSDNNLGITGIIFNRSLFGYSMLGRSTDRNINNMSQSFEWKYAIAQLAVRDVKVINVSMGWREEFILRAFRGEQAIIDMLDTEAHVLEVFFEKTI
jgi:hypothetical protein